MLVVSAQLSNTFAYWPSKTVSIVLSFHKGSFRLCCDQQLMQFIAINWNFFYFYCNTLRQLVVAAKSLQCERAFQTTRPSLFLQYCTYPDELASAILRSLSFQEQKRENILRHFPARFYFFLSGDFYSGREPRIQKVESRKPAFRNLH